MLQKSLKPSLKLLKHSQLFNKIIFKCFSSVTPLKPVKLAFATYETTTDVSNQPPFVILHGLFGSKQNWGSLCKAYQQKTDPKRKIIALDLRNHGDSEHSNSHSYADLAGDVKHFLAENQIDKMALMGHSMGGRCAMLFALKYPEMVEKLVIVDISPVTTSPHLGQMPSIFTTMERVQMPTNVPLSKARIIVEKQLAENIESKDLRAFILTNLVPTDNKSYKWRVNIPVLLDQFELVAKFPLISDMQYSGDTLFLGGGDSNFIPYHDSTVPKRLVYAVDLRNHGDSAHSKDNSYDDMVMDILKFLESMELKRVSLIGHDVGGRVGMLFSLKYPELVEKLIVTDISPITTSNNFKMIPEVLKTLHSMSLPRNLPLHQAKVFAANTLARVVKSKGLMMFILMNLVQKSDGSYSWRFNVKTLLETFSDLSSFPEIHNATFPGPTLFIGGGKSDYIQKSDYPQIKKLFPNAELKYIDGAGHWVHSEKPHEFLKITLEFLNKVNAVS